MYLNGVAKGPRTVVLFCFIWFKEMLIGLFSFLQRSFYILIWTTVPSMPLKNFHVTGLWPFSLRYDHVLSFFLVLNVGLVEVLNVKTLTARAAAVVVVVWKESSDLP